MKPRFLAVPTSMLPLAAAFLVATSCGTDSAKNAGLDAGSPNFGAGGGAGLDAASGDGGNTGDGGSTATADAGPITPGTVDSIWKRASTHLTGVDPSMPTGVVEGTVAIPGANDSEEFDGSSVDLYEQLTGDTLVTYCYLEGDSVYYKVTRPTTHVDALYATTTGDLSRLFEIKKGQLTETFTYTLGTSFVLSETTFTAYKGTFPPASWPQKAVALE